jgi:error-prone DNA polymerase
MKDGSPVRYVGMVICRQRPGTAKNVTFFTLEDETGFVNLVVWERVFERHALVGRTASVLEVRGRVQAVDGVVHVVTDSLAVPTFLAEEAAAPRSRDFH